MSAAPTEASTAVKSVNKFQRTPKPQEDPVVKALKVKTGTLKRNVKDLDFAKAEVTREEARLEKVKAEDPEKTQQQHNVINESKMMIPLAENRIRSSLHELQVYLADNADELAAQSEHVEAAKVAIAEAEQLFPAE